MADQVHAFHWADYLVFITSLVISAAIGIFYAWKDRRRQNTQEFLLGGRKMSIFPVTLSLIASFLSAVLVLGVPTEVYYNGTMYWLISCSNLLTYPVTAHAFVPVFHNLNLSNAYEVGSIIIFLLKHFLSRFKEECKYCNADVIVRSINQYVSSSCPSLKKTYTSYSQ